MSIAEDCKSLELISLHIPKTGGSALMYWLQTIYGKEGVYFDYDENPHNYGQPYQIDPDGYLEKYASGYPFLIGKKAVHGHLWMKKYHNIRDVLRITFLREPVERLISDYWNEKAFSEGRRKSVFENYEPIDSLVRKYRAWNRKIRVRHNPIQSSFFENPPSLLEFAGIPLKRTFYSTLFFGDVGPDKYDFIGDYSRFDVEMQRLKNMLGVAESIDPQKENISSVRANGYTEFRDQILSDPHQMRELKELLAEDLDFYERYAGT
jgi:hypothetical protein